MARPKGLHFILLLGCGCSWHADTLFQFSLYEIEMCCQVYDQGVKWVAECHVMVKASQVVTVL
jgi:hypothetical protein